MVKDGYSASYLFDALNRLVYAQEGGPVEVSSRADEDVRYGLMERDVAGKKALDFSAPNADMRLDYNASSVGVDLRSEANIDKVRLSGNSARINARTLELYTSTTGMDGSWKKEEMLLVGDANGTTLQLEKAVRGQYVKVHSVWDERDEENNALDESTVAGTPQELLEVWATVNGQTTSWTYDSLGNRKTEYNSRGGVTDYSYYANTNRIKAQGVWEYNYDANGNLIERGNSGTWLAAQSRFGWPNNEGELWRYEYDLKNRLVEVKHSLAGLAGLKTVARYVYDSRNLRAAAVKESGTTYYQYDAGGNLIWSEEAQENTKYVYALGGVWAEIRTKGTMSAA